MPIPAQIREVIRLAEIQEREETLFENLKTQKTSLQAQLDLINDQIANQRTVVESARIELKTAAANI